MIVLSMPAVYQRERADGTPSNGGNRTFNLFMSPPPLKRRRCTPNAADCLEQRLRRCLANGHFQAQVAQPPATSRGTLWVPPATARKARPLYRPGFSYRPEQATQALLKVRYCQVSIYQVHPYRESEFAELVESRRLLFDSINLDRPDIAYYVLSGAASGTYVFLAPLPSLKVLDDGWAKAPAHAENIPAESAKTGGFTREHLLFGVEPATSWVSDDFASADPEFWRGKPKRP